MKSNLISQHVDHEFVDVLVIGAGPTGLAMAVEALRHGLTCRIIERKPNRLMNQSKALVIHARTMEQLHAMGDGRVTRRLCETGTKMAKLHAHIGAKGQHKRVHEFKETDEEWGDTDFPFWLVVAQYRTECILEEELERLGGHVEWSTCLKSLHPEESFEDNGNETGTLDHGKSCVKALVARTGQEDIENQNETIQCRWVVGCDGGRSFTREQANLALERESSDAFFFLADVELGTQQAKEMFREDEGNLLIHPEGVMAILPVGEDNLFRIIAHESSRVNPSRSVDLRESPEINKAFIDESVRKRCNINIDTQRISWSSIFRVSYGVSNAYSSGAIFVAGDAVHVHSPIGGQGMNYGLQDAMNLIWKMAWVKRIIDSRLIVGSDLNDGYLLSSSIDSILKSYGVERREAAVQLIKGNALAMKGITSTNPIIRFIRDTVLKRVIGGKRFRLMVSNSLSMLNLGYNSKTSPIILRGNQASRSRMPGENVWKTGSRLPNFTMSNGKKVHDIVGRKRHSWLLVQGEEEASGQTIGSSLTGPGKIPLLIVKGDQKQRKVMPQCMLIRPDLIIAATGEDIDAIWRQVVLLLGKACESM